MSTHNIGEAKTNLSQLIALAESGEEVEFARNGVPVVRLVPIGPKTVGRRFLDTYGSMRGVIILGDDHEFSDGEIDEMYAG